MTEIKQFAKFIAVLPLFIYKRHFGAMSGSIVLVSVP